MESKDKSMRLFENLTGVVAEIGGISLVTNIAMATMPVGTGAVVKFCTKFGAALIGDAAGEYAGDVFVSKVKRVKKAMEEDGLSLNIFMV